VNPSPTDNIPQQQGYFVRPHAEDGTVSGDLNYEITKPDGTPFHWNDFCEGWADTPIRLRKESDAQNAAAFLKKKFGAASLIFDGSNRPLLEARERVPTFVDGLDAQLALWIAESQLAAEDS
jgi:hypothetical protein